MRLSEFIRTDMESIIEEWIGFAETLTPAASTMSKLQLKDHIEQILSFIARDIESNQSSLQQFDKSHGKSDSGTDTQDTASEIHGSIRHADGFDIVQMVSEYRALRASIIKLWTSAKTELTVVDMLDLTRFNESIDQSLAESVARFMQKIDYSKDLLLGVLGHDIRSPLGAITMSAHLLARVGPLNEKQAALTEQIIISSKRVSDIVTDLLDITRARLGSGLPIERQPMSMGALAEQIVDEMRIQYPERTILLEKTGNSEGNWDHIRLGQVFSNLISNAVQYGDKMLPITVSVMGNDTDVAINVHNRGEAIAPHNIATLFDSFTRANISDMQPYKATANLGLGLFITKEIVSAHGGSIDVASSAREGTSFSITLPREAVAAVAA